MLKKNSVQSSMFAMFLIILLTTGAAFANNTPTSDYLKDIQTNARFSRDADGIITDKTTGFQWIEGPDRQMNYNDVLKWIGTLGSKWRVPTMKELHTICVVGAERPPVDPKAKPASKVKVQLDSAFKLGTAWCVWSSDIYKGKELDKKDQKGRYIWYFVFRGDVAKKESWTNRDYNDYHYRGFAIKERKTASKPWFWKK